MMMQKPANSYTPKSGNQATEESKETVQNKVIRQKVPSSSKLLIDTTDKDE